MELLVLFIPFITCIILFIFFRNKVNIIEYVSILGVSLLVYFIYTWADKSISSSDTEYLGDYVTKISHEDEWDEWIHKTCHRRVRSGTDSKGNATYTSIPYDCSYRKKHPEVWYMHPSQDWKFHINKKTFDYYKNLWNTPMRFIDMNRRYYRIDGDAQEYDWDKKPENSVTLSWSNSYNNPIKGSSTSIYKSEKITDEDKKFYELVDYPDIVDKDQNPILGRNFVPQKVIKKWRYINGFYGAKYQFRTFVIFFKNKTPDASMKQISYWEGGNKNEFIIMIGIDNSCKVNWVKIHSWSDDKELSSIMSTFISSRMGKTLDMNEVADQLILNLHKWKRKEFKDFEYIDHEISGGSFTALLIIMIIVSIIGSIIVVSNELDLMGWRNKKA